MKAQIVAACAVWIAGAGCAGGPSSERAKPSKKTAASRTVSDSSRPAPALPVEPSSSLFITSDLRGYLGPCGCSEAMRGGLDKTARLVADAKKNVPTGFIDAGNALFGAALAPASRPQEERKARAIAQIFLQMGLLTRALGSQDLLAGPEFYQDLHLPTVSEGSSATFQIGKIKVATISGRTAAALKQAAADARAQQANFVVGLVPLDWKEASALASENPGADLWVASAGGQLAEENRQLSSLVQLQSRGRSVLRVDFYPQGNGPFSRLPATDAQVRELSLLDERIELLRSQINAPGIEPALLSLKQAKLNELQARRESIASAGPLQFPDKNAFSVRFVPIEPSLPSDAGAAEIVAAYDKDVSALNVAWAKTHGENCPPPEKKVGGYVGSAACRECHADAFPVWEASKHAVAFATLESRGKQHHLDCVSCHVTAWQARGGVCRVDKLDRWKNVGCESCHGPGARHVKDPSDNNIRLKADVQVCVHCHDSENSPHFNFAQYLPLILGPGHGRQRGTQGE